MTAQDFRVFLTNIDLIWYLLKIKVKLSLFILRIHGFSVFHLSFSLQSGTVKVHQQYLDIKVTFFRVENEKVYSFFNTKDRQQSLRKLVLSNMPRMYLSEPRMSIFIL